MNTDLSNVLDQATTIPIWNAQSSSPIQQTTGQIKYPTTISPTKPPMSSQQIIADFQLSQEAWNQLRKQMNVMAEINKLSKKAVQNTYKRVANVQKQNSKKTPNNLKIPKKMAKTVKLVDNKGMDNKGNSKSEKEKNDSSNKKKNLTSKTDSINEIQISDADPHTDICNNDSIGWGGLPEIVTSLEDSDTCNPDRAECLDDSFYEQDHMISNLEYVKLKLSNSAVKLLNSKPIIALFDTGVTCSFISQQLFLKISDKVNMTQKPLRVNTVSATSLGMIGIVPLILDIDNHSFVHNFIICIKLKQSLVIGLDLPKEIK